MRSLSRYPHSALVVHDECVSGATDASYLARLSTMRSSVAPLATDYSAKASNSELYLIAPRKIPLNLPAVGAATRKDLKDLYERFMVGIGAPGRVHYGGMLLSAPHERCPYCGLGRATTLDHYLPKSRYPQFSVTPDNLVPACKDCQGKKGRHVAATGPAQTLHPYFDDARFFTTRWIFGGLSSTIPLSVSFKAIPPKAWSLQDQQRASAHFKAHNLGERFAVEAATELSVLREVFQHYRDAGDFSSLAADLNRWTQGYANQSMNSWQSALYHTLASSAWYCSSSVV